mmetsp:Transcript_45077/g.97915  ORF Transcript_45077/g.97915 Transcript_45077/m.97915 type:complete len:221 (-) Transcript_45077:1396-2058(-)
MALLPSSRVALKICSGEPDALPCAWSKVAHVLLVLWHNCVRRPRPHQQGEAPAPLHAGDSVDIPLAATEGDAGAQLAPVHRTWLLLPPVAVKLYVSAAVLPGIVEGHGGAVVAEGRLRRLPQHLSTTACSHQLISLFHLAAAPPDRIELEVVAMRRVADVVCAADRRLIEHHGMPISLHHGVHDLLGNTSEDLEVLLPKFRLLVVPGVRQVVLIPVPHLP